jgi:hypothetical protein
MSKEIVAGGERRKRSVIRTWVTNQSMFTGNLFINNNRFYIVDSDHISSTIQSDIAQGNIRKLDRRVVSSGYRDIGPFIATAGHYSTSSNRDTGIRYSDYTNNEVVVGFAPVAQPSDNGGWSDGGRVTVRFGFMLRLQKLNEVD